MSKFSSTVHSVGYSAAVKASQSISSTLKEMATDAGWPAEIAEQLSVSVKDNNLSVSYPPNLRKAVEDLEYGTESDPPRPVLRRFDYLLPSLIQPHFEKELESRMAEVVGSL